MAKRLNYRLLEIDGTIASGSVDPSKPMEGWKFHIDEQRKYMIDVWSVQYLKIELSPPGAPDEILAEDAVPSGGPDITQRLEPGDYYVRVILGPGWEVSVSYTICIKKFA